MTIQYSIGEPTGQAAQLAYQRLSFRTVSPRTLQYGAGELTYTMLQHGLVDEFRFLVFPFTFGEGPRIFEQMGIHTLKLLDTQTFSSSAVAHRYQPQGHA